MKAFKEFSIPVEGLKDGVHELSFKVTPSFFDAFENSMIKNGNFSIRVELEKKPGLFDLNFDISGTYFSDCDRCLAEIQLNMDTNYRLLVKKSEEVAEDPDVKFISPEATELNIAQELYEIISLAVPLVKTVDCGPGEEEFCNTEVLSKFENSKEEKSSSVWDDLKNINFNKN